jgi:hypothetical protein
VTVFDVFLLIQKTITDVMVEEYSGRHAEEDVPIHLLKFAIEGFSKGLPAFRGEWLIWRIVQVLALWVNIDIGNPHCWLIMDGELALFGCQ